MDIYTLPIMTLNFEDLCKYNRTVYNHHKIVEKKYEILKEYVATCPFYFENINENIYEIIETYDKNYKNMMRIIIGLLKINPDGNYIDDFFIPFQISTSDFYTRLILEYSYYCWSKNNNNNQLKNDKPL
jgi:predicted AAA+ superfamily ATPase